MSKTYTGGACYHSHPALKVGDHKIYGGNCGNPVHLDCDVYVSLQSGLRVQLPQPWEDGFGKIVQVLFPIEDMGTPKNTSEFKKMIDWLCNQLQEGKKVHVGCIGGHGRTGMVLAAVVAKMMPAEDDAIGYVRKNYCHKAVESSAQVNYLHTHFGCKVVKGAKEGLSLSGAWNTKSSSSGWKAPTKSGGAEFPSKKTATFAHTIRSVEPMASPRNIYKNPLTV